MGLYEINNPKSLPSHSKPFTPACSWAPLCASDACDPLLDVADRVTALLASMTLEEKVSNVIDSAAGSVRLGLQPYEWWSEALHGVGNSPAVLFQGVNGSDFSYATSFPMPILMGATFDDQLIQQVAGVIGKEARALPISVLLALTFGPQISIPSGIHVGAEGLKLLAKTRFISRAMCPI